MTHPAADHAGHPSGYVANRSHWTLIAGAMAVGAVGVIVRLADLHFDPSINAIIYGISILAAASLLSWAAETAEMDISQGLALAIIAFIAVLPEYAVDFVLAWEAGADPAEAEKGLAVANMTGGNRLLIGLGWPIVFGIFLYRVRGTNILQLARQHSLEVAFLSIATAYVIFIPLRSTLMLTDTIVLVTIFICYLIATMRAESEEVELVGPAATLGSLQETRRRGAVIALMLYAAVVIIAVAEPFAHSLVETGEKFDISEFLLIQWLAPLASESPEVVVAGLLAWRGRAGAGMGALISSKVNQWTLLIGTLPIAFMMSSGDWGLTNGLPLDHRQQEEIFLTAAQSVFAIAVFIDLSMSRWQALALLLLFSTQLVITNESARVVFAFVYIILAAGMLIYQRTALKPMIQDAIATARGKMEPGDTIMPPGEEDRH